MSFDPAFIFTATLRAAVGNGGEEAVARRLAELLEGDIWCPQGVVTADTLPGSVLLEVYTKFPEGVFVPDEDSELSVEQQAEDYASDELAAVIDGTGFSLYGDVSPSEDF